MRFLILLPFVLSSCVAPSITVYGKGKDRHGKDVAVKEFQAYGDFVGKTEIKGSLVTVSSEGGYYNSTVVRETYLGAAEIGRSTIQPIVWSIVTGGALGAAINTGASTATNVAAP